VPIFSLYRRKETYDCLGYIRSPYVPGVVGDLARNPLKKTLGFLKNKKNSKSHEGMLMPKLKNINFNFKII